MVRLLENKGKIVIKIKNELFFCHEKCIIIVTNLRSVLLWQVEFMQKSKREY